MTFTTVLFSGFSIQGADTVDELSTETYKGIASYSDESQKDISLKLTWTTDSNEASVTSSGVVTTQQVYDISSFNLFATLNYTSQKKIIINDINLGLTSISQMLDSAPLIQEEFYEFVSPKVENFDIALLTEYQTEFERNLDYVEDKADWYQTIINEANVGRNIVINHVSSGWNMISSPFEDWYPDLINPDFQSRNIYTFDREKSSYQDLFSSFKLELCKAYWIYFSDTEIPEEEHLEYYMSGNLQLDHNLELSVGWNFIGGSKNDETVTDDFDVFIWDTFIEGYHKLGNRVLKLGKGYWVFKFN